MALVMGVAVAGMSLAAGSASAAVTPNPWLTNRFLNIAHQGGEDEAPSNTLYAFKSAIKEGAPTCWRSTCSSASTAT